MKRITIQDVARESGVSITTVSRVINKNYPVKESTKQRVQAAIDQLKFKPNLLARSLIQNSTKTVGILIPSLENLFFSEVINGIDSVIKSHGYTTFLCNTEGESANEIEMVNSLVYRQVDGIIIVDPRKANVISGYYEELSKRVPLVLINGYSESIECNYILSDSQGGMLEALKYFSQKRCKRIAFLRGNKSHSYDSKEEIYKAYIKKNQLEVCIINIKDGNNVNTVEQAKEAVVEVLQSETIPDAILACNDWMAVGALNGARALGITVGETLRIVGFDNTIISQITEPKLSTVDQKMIELGRLAASRIYTMMMNKDTTNKKIYLETKLIIRET